MKKIALLFSSCLLGTVANAQLANGGMETWRSFTSNTTTLEIPNDWFGGDSTIYDLEAQFPGVITPQQTLFKETTDVHSGAYSVKLTTVDISGFEVPGLLSNANPIIDPMAVITTGDVFGNLTYEGGTAVSQRYISASAWVKYTPAGNDVAAIGVIAIKTIGGNDSVIGNGTTYLSATTNFTEVNVPITYKDATTVPDKIIITFLSSDASNENGTTPQVGSTLYVDDVSLSMTSGVKELFTQTQIGQIYPNPATTSLTITADNAHELSLRIFNATGALMKQTQFKNQTKLPLGDFAAGIYFYEIKDVQDRKIQKGSFSVVN